MAIPPGFYNQETKLYILQVIFIPQERFRAAPYNVNTPTAPDDPAASGIAAVYRPQGSSGGGGDYRLVILTYFDFATAYTSKSITMDTKKMDMNLEIKLLWVFQAKQELTLFRIWVSLLENLQISFKAKSYSRKYNKVW